MNRNYSSEDYLDLIKRIKSYIPEIAITTDVLVGFPGETETAFRNTIDLIKEISPSKVHIFPFSPREQTPAYSFEGRINPIIIKERIQRLKDISKICELTYKKKFLNRDISTLIECQSKSPLIWKGLTDNYIRILVKSSQNLKNQLIYLRLKSIAGDYVLADFC
jgi:threonylcarbamoyladenosine tRNA methylthiotransferase MtaB